MYKNPQSNYNAYTLACNIQQILPTNAQIPSAVVLVTVFHTFIIFRYISRRYRYLTACLRDLVKQRKIRSSITRAIRKFNDKHIL